MRWIPCLLLVLLGADSAAHGEVGLLAGLALLGVAWALWVWLGARHLQLASRGDYDAAQRAARWVLDPDARLRVRSLAGDDSVGADLEARVTERPPRHGRATAQALYAEWLCQHGEVAPATHYAEDATRHGDALGFLILAQLQLQQGHSCAATRAGLYLVLHGRRLKRLGGPSLRSFPLALLAWAHALDGDTDRTTWAEEHALSAVAPRQAALRAAVGWALGHAHLVLGEQARAREYWEAGSKGDLGAWGEACRDAAQRRLP